MRSTIRLGRILGIEVGLHYSWILIAILVTLSLAAQFHTTNVNWGGTVIWAMAVLTGLLFFASIVLHELSHAVVARRRRLPVRAITLFALGGVAQIENEPEDASTEFWMGIIGPITSFVIGGLCLGIVWIAGWSPGSRPDAPLAAMTLWLGYINVTLAVFNMIPGFPLDGGRVLRAVLWWVTGDAGRSLQISARIGLAVAFGFILLGFFRFFTGSGIGGLWLAFIGWFLLEAARESYSRVRLTDELRGIRVGDIMARDCPTIDSETNLQAFAEDHLLRTGRRCYVVIRNGAVAGLITPNELRGIDKSRWPFTTVNDTMRPLEGLHTVNPDTPVSEAMDSMGREDLNQLPVVLNHHLEGVITRGHVLQFLQARNELKA
jgi:Zn-dependent protease/predicted transcriptional regulator